MRISSIVSLLVTMLIGIFLFYQFFQIKRDVTDVAYRAGVAVNASGMLINMRQLKSGMERHGMTHGHTALILKTPRNDLTKLNDSITGIIMELETIRKIPHNQTAYILGLESIRGTIRKLECPAMGYVWVQYWFLFFAGTIIWIWPIMIVLQDEDE